MSLPMERKGSVFPPKMRKPASFHQQEHGHTALGSSVFILPLQGGCFSCGPWTHRPQRRLPSGHLGTRACRDAASFLWRLSLASSL